MTSNSIIIECSTYGAPHAESIVGLRRVPAQNIERRSHCRLPIAAAPVGWSHHCRQPEGGSS
jgi:hypothetical protein